MRRIAFYGGSFDPPHIGHQATILQVLSLANVEELAVVPVFKHYDGKILRPFHHRLTMAQRLITPFGGLCPPTYVSSMEQTAFDNGSRGITAESLKTFRRVHGYEHDHIVLVLGSDIQVIIHKWEGYEQLKEWEFEGLLSFYFVERFPRISSTEIRNQLSEGHPELARRWVPNNIMLHIEQNGLYV